MYSIKNFSDDLESIITYSNTYEDLIKNSALKLSQLLNNDELFTDKYIDDIRNFRISNNLYESSNNGFVIQLFVWEPNSNTPIHDHFTWGLMGIYYNKLKITEYSLDKIENNTYDLNEADKYIAGEGDICYVLPPNDEIHQISNPTNNISMSIHIYGKPIDKYNIYDLEQNKIFQINS